MARGSELTELEGLLGYRFRDQHLLDAAMTHSSFANEERDRSHACSSNERLEFLGDSVLGFHISCYLYETYPNDPEGVLARMRQELVCEGTLARVARRISLGKFLSLGKGEEQTGSRERSSILADALEALIASVHLDGSGEGTAEVIRRLFESELLGCRHFLAGDYKTRLQQLVQQDGMEELTYRVSRESGPEHDKKFEVEACLNSNVVGVGYGKTKRDAEQMAAKIALSLFGIE